MAISPSKPRIDLLRAMLSGLLLVAACSPFSSTEDGTPAVRILNVSFDPTRELFDEVNRAFAASWRKSAGQTVRINMSHGGSGKQARAVIEGLGADVVTLGLGYDVDAIANAGLLDKDWQNKLPQHASPYFSTVVFVVRQPNPRNIADWRDLLQPGCAIVTPNPKTSGGARWNYLAAWAYALRHGGDEGAAKQFMQQLLRNVVVLDAGARGATTTFVERGIGDVLVTWESEALLALEKAGRDRFAIVSPSLSIRAELPVAVVDKVARRKGNSAVARAYLEFLYSDEGQALALRHHFRPQKSIAELPAEMQKTLEMVTVESLEGSWRRAHAHHFADGGTFDQITQAAP